MNTQRKISALITAACVAVVVGGCTKDPAVAKQRHLEKAQGYYAKGKYNEAIIEIKNALQIDPEFAPAVHLAGRAYAAKGWYLDAVSELRRAVELEPENLAARIDLARAYIQIEAWDDALREATTITAKEPANAWAMYVRAATLNAKQQRPAALAAIEQALKAGPPPPEFHTVHG